MNATFPAAAKKSYSGFLFLSLVLASIFIIVVLMPLEPSDYWTYLRIGEEIIRIQAIPTTEFMTYTSGGQAANYSYWLASLIFLGLYKAGGFWLTALACGVSVVAFYALFWMCLRDFKMGPLSASLVLFLTAMMGSNNWSTRPQVFVFPLFGLTLLILIRWLEGQNRWLWLIPLMTILWVNLHGSYILLFVLFGAALVFGGGNRKSLILVLALSMAATWINPYGFKLWSNALTMMGNDLIATYSAEWQPPVNQGWQLNLFFGSLLLTAFIAAFSKVRLKPVWWILFLGFGWMGLSSVRYVIWFSAIAALLLTQLTTPWLERYLDRFPIFPRRGFNLLLGSLILVSSLAFLPGLRQSWWRQAPPNITATTPVEAVAWLRDRPELPDHFWANWVASIYMTYAIPERQVWITNRIEDFTELQFVDNERLMRTAFDWQEILDKYGVNLLLLDRAREKPLIEVVLTSTLWHQIYQNDQSLVFIRDPQINPAGE